MNEKTVERTERSFQEMNVRKTVRKICYFISFRESNYHVDSYKHHDVDRTSNKGPLVNCFGKIIGIGWVLVRFKMTVLYFKNL